MRKGLAGAWPAACSVVGWDELDLEKVTELISRKLVAGERQMLVQVYLKRGALVPLHTHESEQLTYVLDGILKVRVGGEEVLVRDGEGRADSIRCAASDRGARGYVRTRSV